MMDFRIALDALTKIANDIVNFIPNLVNGLVILFAGYLVALVVRWLVVAVLRRAKVDMLIERVGLTGALRGLGVETPFSVVLGQIIFVLLLLSFLITATRLMGLSPVAQLFERLMLFLPAIIAAAIVFLLGGMVAQYVGAMATMAAANAGIGSPGRLGKLVQHVISIFVVIISLSVLGMDTAVLVTALTIMIAAFGLALGLALGLGARRTVQHVLAGYYVRQRFRVGQPIAFDEVSGDVSGIGGVNTVVRTEEGDIVLPNAVLIESVVRSPRPPRNAAAAPADEPV